MTGGNQINEISGFQLRINDSAVLVRFSSSAEQTFRGIINVSGEMDFPAGTLKTEKRSSNAIPYK